MIALILALFLTQGSEAKVFSNFQLVNSMQRVCLTDLEGIKCVDLDSGEILNFFPAQQFTDIKKISFIENGFGLAVLDGEELKYTSIFRQEKFSTLDRGISDFSAGMEEICLIRKEDKKMGCLPSLKKIDKGIQYLLPFDLEVRSISISDDVTAARTCILSTNDYLKCWGPGIRTTPEEDGKPTLVNPRAVLSDKYFALVLDDESLKIWRDNPWKIPPEKNPWQVSASIWEICTLGAGGVQCQGDNYEKHGLKVPSLANPVSVAVGSNRSCAMDDTGLHCWGLVYVGNDHYRLRDPLDVPLKLLPDVDHPVLNLDQVGSYLEFLRKVSMGLKAEFFGSMKDMARDLGPRARRQEIADMNFSRYFAAKLLGPAILSGDSLVFQKISSRFQKDMQEIEAELKVGDADAITDSALNRKIALQALRAGVTTGLNVFSAAERGRLQDLLRAIGLAAQDPMNGEKLRAVLDGLAGIEAEKAKLRSSIKSAFLVDAMDLAEAWLKEKIK